jgi:cytochrome b
MTLRPKQAGILLPMRVWDAATRLFHWALVVLFLLSYISVSLADGPSAGPWMRVHVLSGEGVLALLVFRLLWGLFGSETSRFARFLHSPLEAVRHLAGLFRREADTQVGHNAAGGWVVLLMLALLIVQVATGLGSNDDGDTEGPLVRFMSHANSNLLSKIHGINFNILLGVVCLHVAAVAFYGIVKRQNLLRPMITGKKRLPAATRAPRMASQLLAAAMLAIAAGVAVAVSRL